MKTQFPLGCIIVVLGGLAAMGCIASPDAGVTDNDAPLLQDEAFTQNAFTQNAFTQNAFTQNAFTQNALSKNAFTQNALIDNAFTQNALSDPNARELFTYIVSCALPEGEDISYQVGDDTYTFSGSLGLAPEWGREHGQCNESCQQWVSACVLSRLDYLGEHVTISIRGKNRALASSPFELASYTHREATYYGNIFSNPPRYLGCLPPGETQDPRVCGPSLDGCVIEFQGSCDDVCGPVRPDGSYPNCHGPSDHDDDDDRAYFGSITVFLKP